MTGDDDTGGFAWLYPHAQDTTLVGYEHGVREPHVFHTADLGFDAGDDLLPDIEGTGRRQRLRVRHAGHHVQDVHQAHDDECGQCVDDEGHPEDAHDRPPRKAEGVPANPGGHGQTEGHPEGEGEPRVLGEKATNREANSGAGGRAMLEL
jgi:hypothetical protein